MNTNQNTLASPYRPVALGLALALGTMTLAAGCSSFSQGVGGSTEPAQDTWITTKVRTALATVENVDSTAIGVETNMGVVALTGQVDSRATLDRIVTAVGLVDGVQRVDASRLTIGGG